MNYTTSLSADVFFAILDALPDGVAPPDVWLPMSAGQGLRLRATELRVWKADE